jgi:hypothetical protein
MPSQRDETGAVTREQLRELLIMHRGLEVARRTSQRRPGAAPAADMNRAHALLDRLPARPAH